MTILGIQDVMKVEKPEDKLVRISAEIQKLVQQGALISNPETPPQQTVQSDAPT